MEGHLHIVDAGLARPLRAERYATAQAEVAELVADLAEELDARSLGRESRTLREYARRCDRFDELCSIARLLDAMSSGLGGEARSMVMQTAHQVRRALGEE